MHVGSTGAAQAEGDSIQSRCDAWHWSALPPSHAREARIARGSPYSKHHHVLARSNLAHRKQSLTSHASTLAILSQGAKVRSWYAGTNVHQSVTTEVGFERQRIHGGPALMLSRTLT